MILKIPFEPLDTIYMVDKKEKSFKEFELGERFNLSRGINMMGGAFLQVNYPVDQHNQGAIVLHSINEGDSFDVDNDNRLLTTDINEAKAKMMEIL